MTTIKSDYTSKQMTDRQFKAVAEDTGSRKMLDDWRHYKLNYNGFDGYRLSDKTRIEDSYISGWLDGHSAGHAYGMEAQAAIAASDAHLVKGLVETLEREYRRWVESSAEPSATRQHITHAATAVTQIAEILEQIPEDLLK